MRASSALLAIAVFTASCGSSGGSSSSTGGPSDSTPPPSGTVPVFIRVSPPSASQGTFSLMLDGAPVTSTEQRFNVTPGVHQVSGQITPATSSAGVGLGIDLLGISGQDVAQFGGAQKGSIQAVEGPHPKISDCGVLYLVEFGSAVQPYEVRFQFFASGTVTPERRC